MRYFTLAFAICSCICTGYGQGDFYFNPQASFPLYNPTSPHILNSAMLFPAFGNRTVKVNYSEGFEKDKARYRMSIVHDFYRAQELYPEYIPDGWHEVVAMDNHALCQQAKVLVENNLVTQYVLDDWIYKEMLSDEAIRDGKAKVVLVDQNAKRKNTHLFLDLYFVDYMNTPGTVAAPPVLPGKISFWAGDVGFGDISVILDGKYQGDLSPGYPFSDPECDGPGTLTVEYKSGIFDFRAYNERNAWRGTVVIYPGECTLKALTKENNTASEYGH